MGNVIFIKFEKLKIPDQYIEGMGWISKDGQNFLRAMLRLARLQGDG